MRSLLRLLQCFVVLGHVKFESGHIQVTYGPGIYTFLKMCAFLADESVPHILFYTVHVFPKPMVRQDDVLEPFDPRPLRFTISVFYQSASPAQIDLVNRLRGLAYQETRLCNIIQGADRAYLGQGKPLVIDSAYMVPCLDCRDARVIQHATVLSLMRLRFQVREIFSQAKELGMGTFPLIRNLDEFYSVAHNPATPKLESAIFEELKK